MYARNTGVRLSAAAVATVLLAALGCSGGSSGGPTTEEFKAERQKVAQRLKEKQQQKAARPAPAPAPKPARDATGLGLMAGDFSYDPMGKRDPFRSFEWERPDRIDEASLRGPLEQFDVNQLSLVAIVWQTGNARALVQDPTGESYIIAEGARVGKNEGRVIRIDDNLVVVKERYLDYLGQETTKDIEIRIRRSEGG